MERSIEYSEAYWGISPPRLSSSQDLDSELQEFSWGLGCSSAERVQPQVDKRLDQSPALRKLDAARAPEVSVLWWWAQEGQKFKVTLDCIAS